MKNLYSSLFCVILVIIACGAAFADEGKGRTNPHSNGRATIMAPISINRNMHPALSLYIRKRNLLGTFLYSAHSVSRTLASYRICYAKNC